MTQSGGRAVQVQTPPEDCRQTRGSVRPPAAKAPEMVLPRRDVKVTKSTTPAPKGHRRRPTTRATELHRAERRR